MEVNHVGEALVGLGPLPLEVGTLVVEESLCPAFTTVIPELAERLLQDESGIEPLVGREQQCEWAFAVRSEIVTVRQQRVLLSYDKTPILTAQAGVSGLAYIVEGLGEVSHDMELVEKDSRLRRFSTHDVAEGRSHVYRDGRDLAALFAARPGAELRYASLRAVVAAELDRSLIDQGTDHDATAVALTNVISSIPITLGLDLPARSIWAIMYCISNVRLNRLPIGLQLLGDLPVTEAGW